MCIANNDEKTHHSTSETGKFFWVAILKELPLQILRQPPCSTGLSPADCRFFRNVHNFLRGEKLNFDEAVNTALIELPDFLTYIPFRKGS